MYRSRAVLSNLSFLTENLEPKKPLPRRKGIILYIRGIVTPQDKIRHEKKFELIPGELGLKYLNDDDKMYYEKQHFQTNKLRHEEIVIEWRHEELEDISDSNNPLFNAFTALRLFKEGPVFIKYLYTIDEKKALLHKSMNFVVPDTYTDYDKIFIYELKEEESLSFKQIFDLLNNKDELDENIKLCLEWFQSTYYPKPARNVLLEIMIAFEALFLKDYRSGGKGQTLAIACSLLLGNTQLERETIKTTIADFYQVRNNIIHGSPYDENEIKENFYTLRNYLRRSIIKLLN